MASIRDDESLVDPDDRVEDDHGEVYREVEQIQAGFGVIPCWVGDGPRNIRGPCAERRTESQHCRADKQDDDLRAEAAFAKVLSWTAGGQNSSDG